jgi:hypothetical protein
MGDERVVLDEAGGSLAFRFEARDLNLVVGSASPVSFTVLLDGRAPGEDAGIDVDASGRGVLVEPRMYQLVRARGPVRPRTFEVRFDGPGVGAYVLTFG